MSEQAKKVITVLKQKYPRTKHYLNFKTTLDLLVASILSPQVQDERVNAVTKDLFKKYRKAEDYARLSVPQLVMQIKTISFAGNKAKAIIGSCKILVKEYKGRVPKDINALIKLPGVGRKTANSISIHAYNIVKGIPCDTHVLRVSYRLGWTKEKKPDNVEKDLMKLVSKTNWKRLPALLKDHGRAVCKAPTPICSQCPVEKLCPKKGVTKKK